MPFLATSQRLESVSVLYAKWIKIIRVSEYVFEGLLYLFFVRSAFVIVLKYGIYHFINPPRPH